MSQNKNNALLDLLKAIFGFVMQLIGKNKLKEEIAENQQDMQNEWDKIDQEQKEDFAEIDSMSLEDLKDEFNKR